MPRIRKPLSCVLASRMSRTAGTRLAQLAKTNPQSAKMVKTALRQWISSRDGFVLVVGTGGNGTVRKRLRTNTGGRHGGTGRAGPRGGRRHPVRRPEGAGPHALRRAVAASRGRPAGRVGLRLGPRRARRGGGRGACAGARRRRGRRGATLADGDRRL